MDKIFRIIDANINRASEGLRVLEDVTRFYFNDKALSEKLKVIRHNIRKNITDYLANCLNSRDSLNDVGLSISMGLNIDNKSSLLEVTTANFKRIQEALRTVEENLKAIGKYKLSKVYEQYRFNCYNLEKDFYKKSVSTIKRKKLNTDLYCITAEEYSKGRSNIDVVKAMVEAGVKLIQYREKEKSMIDKYTECKEIRKVTKEAGATFIVNDHVDLAVMVEADGVHIGQDDLPVSKVRELVGEEMIIGVSTHSPEQAHRAVDNGADYIGVGPIFKTFTKKDVCDPVGLEYLEYVVKNIDIPFVAIGGIKEHNMLEVKGRGAKCIAVVTEIVSADNICKKIESIKRKFKED